MKKSDIWISCRVTIMSSYFMVKEIKSCLAGLPIMKNQIIGLPHAPMKEQIHLLVVTFAIFCNAKGQARKGTFQKWTFAMEMTLARGLGYTIWTRI